MSRIWPPLIVTGLSGLGLYLVLDKDDTSKDRKIFPPKEEPITSLHGLPTPPAEIADTVHDEITQLLQKSFLQPFDEVSSEDMRKYGFVRRTLGSRMWPTDTTKTPRAWEKVKTACRRYRMFVLYSMSKFSGEKSLIFVRSSRRDLLLDFCGRDGKAGEAIVFLVPNDMRLLDEEESHAVPTRARSPSLSSRDPRTRRA